MSGTVELTNVSKVYRKYSDTAALRGRLAGFFVRTEESMFSAVKDVSLTISPGESVGVLGRNGAGKSTLLQLLCGVTAPSRGRVRVVGKVAPWSRFGANLLAG